MSFMNVEKPDKTNNVEFNIQTSYNLIGISLFTVKRGDRRREEWRRQEERRVEETGGEKSGGEKRKRRGARRREKIGREGQSKQTNKTPGGETSTESITCRVKETGIFRKSEETEGGSHGKRRVSSGAACCQQRASALRGLGPEFSPLSSPIRPRL
ncbi:hypothetical protein NHX12_001520 [Muraenolepis orangiensis]|uniref:Uncharacterized protein n=1 Tax=Muraenolepis orangiensis TaxID=630683 RepID=A0A9Q0DZV0_9TELE|nr:hypothetical protein NHX12_001520 [Muraenolepis orangiensis]